jgi:CheY-like chemotaxis protein
VILIVDDDFDIRDSLCDILSDQGYEVVSASDGIEALDFLDHHAPPCLILLDWMMPRCDGAEFRVKQLARPAPVASVPVVLLTADASAAGRSGTIQVAEIVIKPVRLHRLLEIVGRYC